MGYKVIVILLSRQRQHLSFSLGMTCVQAAEPTETLTIRLVHPEQQLERLIALFKGTRSPPGRGAWRPRQREPRLQGLAKASEAAIAALNPGMIRELLQL